MNRRNVLIGAGTALSLSLAGCLDDVAFWRQGPPEDEHGNCPEEYGIFVGLQPEVPTDADVLDARGESLLEIDGLAEALSDAHEEYEDGMEDEIDEYEELAATMDDRELYRELDGSEWHIEYENVTYQVRSTVELTC